MKSSDFHFGLHRNFGTSGADPNLRLIIKSGLAQQISSGIHAYLPLGTRILNRIRELMMRLMNSIGAQEIILPILQPYSLWEKSQRVRKYGSELFRLKDRLGSWFVLCPTSEELVTRLIGGRNLCRHQLPTYVYQIQFKFRDEMRPRFGLVRSKEFLMKDCYSFDATAQDCDLSYKLLSRTYKKIFRALGIKFRKVHADNGAMGGMRSHEFQAFSSYGEGSIIYCPHSNYAISEPPKPMVGDHLMLVPGLFRRIVWAPTQASSNVLTEYLLADPKTVASALVASHSKNARLDVFTKNSWRDEMEWRLTSGVGISTASDKQRPCSSFSTESKMFGSQSWSWAGWMTEPSKPNSVMAHYAKQAKAVEVGHIFQLGTTFSSRMEARYNNATNTKPYAMGCYGIGITRILSVLVDQQCDEGCGAVCWPSVVAPFGPIFIPEGYHNNAQIRSVANRIYSSVRPLHNAFLEDRRRDGAETLDELFAMGINEIVVLNPQTIITRTTKFSARRPQRTVKVTVTMILVLLEELERNLQ